MNVGLVTTLSENRLIMLLEIYVGIFCIPIGHYLVNSRQLTEQSTNGGRHCTKTRAGAHTDTQTHTHARSHTHAYIDARTHTHTRTHPIFSLSI